VYANTFFAMLNGREHLKKELGTKSIITSVFKTDDSTRLDNSFHAPRKGSDVETSIEAPQNFWMNTLKGGKSGDKFGIAQIQVDKRVEVSDI